MDKTSANTLLLKKIIAQLLTIKESKNNNSEHVVFPRSRDRQREIMHVDKSDWTSGFYLEIPWQLYSLNNDDSWKEKTLNYTDLLKTEKFNFQKIISLTGVLVLQM